MICDTNWNIFLSFLVIILRAFHHAINKNHAGLFGERIYPKVNTHTNKIFKISHIDDPPVYYVPELLNDEHIKYLLKQVGMYGYTPSPTKSAENQEETNEQKNWRKSSTCFASPEKMKIVTKYITNCLFTDIDYIQCETPQITKYEKHNYYKTHLDALFESENHRIATVIVYLNDVLEGGNTTFQNIRWGNSELCEKLGSKESKFISIKPNKGSSIIFFPSYTNKNTNKNQIDMLGWHSAEQVIKGEKHIMQIWIRENEFKLTDTEI